MEDNILVLLVNYELFGTLSTFLHTAKGNTKSLFKYSVNSVLELNLFWTLD